MWTAAPLREKLNNMNWGIEFLDDMWHERPLPRPPRPRDAWRTTRFAASTVLVARPLVEMVAQTVRLSQIRARERDVIDEIGDSIRQRGFDLPLLLVVDSLGTLLLKDGHHRIAAIMGDDRVPLVPVRFKTAERVQVSGGQAASLMIPLLLGIPG